MNNPSANRLAMLDPVPTLGPHILDAGAELGELPVTDALPRRRCVIAIAIDLSPHVGVAYESPLGKRPQRACLS
jgi:hypothetical protein